MSKSQNRVRRETAISAPVSAVPSVNKALVFISHDSRDGELAEAFGKLIHGITAGMLKAFRSSDKTGTQGLEYGSEWYTEIMKRIDGASDVVCLLTPRSFERPWILYEAGVAKGKLGTPVHGLVLGMQMSQVTGSGPFGQFQNCSGEVDALTGLVLQLARRVPGCDPVKDIVETQVKAFLAQAESLIKAGSGKKTDNPRKAEEDIAAKLFEEIKVMFKELPQQIASQVGESVEPRRRKRGRSRMVHEHLRFVMAEHKDPQMALLMLAGLLREEAPWLQEIVLQAVNAIRDGDGAKAQKILEEFRHMLRMSMRGPFGPEFFEEPEMLMMAEDLMMRLESRLRARRPRDKELGTSSE